MNNIIPFYSVADKYGEFSNWYICDFTMDKINFISSEQALMYFKAITFKDYMRAEVILRLKSQHDIKKLGRQVNNYDDSVWNSVRQNIMETILEAKFSQNKKLEKIIA